ncbi:hypothetical protein HPB50_019326 [Hyalomma asiaticum]|uniref:Uncharacterized protein n=1 Tax=Hyalomma asiaticum TaxID=266040 RepID=A0ACB7RPY6_HYAAI|nr:hypothetical protein HPB50_019326 [Hyalomma asiaticum]
MTLRSATNRKQLSEFKWNTVAVMHATGRASEPSQEPFNEKVHIQVQRFGNLIIAHTPDKEDAKKAVSVNRIRLGGIFYNANSSILTANDFSTGVINGLIPERSSAKLMSLIRAPPRYTVVHGRMLGQSATADVFFERPQVPYSIVFQRLYNRCRPYRKRLQY